MPEPQLGKEADWGLGFRFGGLGGVGGMCLGSILSYKDTVHTVEGHVNTELELHA